MSGEVRLRMRATLDDPDRRFNESEKLFFENLRAFGPCFTRFFEKFWGCFVAVPPRPPLHDHTRFRPFLSLLFSLFAAANASIRRQTPSRGGRVFTAVLPCAALTCAILFGLPKRLYPSVRGFPLPCLEMSSKVGGGYFTMSSS